MRPPRLPLWTGKCHRHRLCEAHATAGPAATAVSDADDTDAQQIPTRHSIPCDQQSARVEQLSPANEAGGGFPGEERKALGKEASPPE